MFSSNSIRLALLALLASSAIATECDSLKACYLRDLSTGKEITLTGTDSYKVDATNKAGYSIRCLVNYNSGTESNFIKFFWDGQEQTEWNEPRWMLGDSNTGDYVVPVPYLATCGAKTVKIEGHVWSNKCFDKEYKLTAQCDAVAPKASPVAPPKAAAPIVAAPKAASPVAAAPVVAAPAASAPKASAPVAAAPVVAAPKASAPVAAAPVVAAPKAATSAPKAPTSPTNAPKAPTSAPYKAPTDAPKAPVSPPVAVPVAAPKTPTSAPKTPTSAPKTPVVAAPLPAPVSPPVSTPVAKAPTVGDSPVASAPSVASPTAVSPSAPSAMSPTTGVAPTVASPSAASPSAPVAKPICKPGYKLVSGYCVIQSCKFDYRCPENMVRLPNRKCYNNNDDCGCAKGYTKKMASKLRSQKCPCRKTIRCDYGMTWLGNCKSAPK